MAMRKGQIDSRFVSERSGHTETTCDVCWDVILTSEPRFILEIKTVCDVIACKSCVDMITVNMGGGR